MQYIKGNLLNTPCLHIVHGCNGIGVMGAGVALAIKNKWPKAFNDYKTGLIARSVAAPVTFEEKLLGTDFPSYVEDNKIIHNLITQMKIGNGKHARYYAIIDGIRNILDYNIKINELAIPKIGCGLGGCKWEVVEELLLEIEKDYMMEFLVYEL